MLKKYFVNWDFINIAIITKLTLKKLILKVEISKNVRTNFGNANGAEKGDQLNERYKNNKNKK